MSLPTVNSDTLTLLAKYIVRPQPNTISNGELLFFEYACNSGVDDLSSDFDKMSVLELIDAWRMESLAQR